MKVYLAGKMSDVESFGYDAFNEAAERLRAQGHEVFNPADNDGNRLSDHGTDNGVDFKTGEVVDQDKFRKFLRDVFKEDLVWICEQADAIALLPGWESSGGARAEWAVAHVLRLKFIYL